MMLVRSSLPSSIDAGLASVPDHGKQKILCVWIPGDGSWQEPTVCDDHPQQDHPNTVPITEHKNKDDSLCCRNFLSSQLSTEVNMYETSTPNFVYKRRMIQRNAAAAPVLPLSRSSTPTLVYKRRKVQTVFPAQVSTNTRESDNCFSANSSAAISVAGKEQMISVLHIDNGTLITPALLPVESNRPGLASKSGFIDGASLGDELIIEEVKSKMRKCPDLPAVNESCSSSKSNMDLGSASLKHQVDDVGECSSSGVLIMEGLGKDILETNSCISFLRHHGVLEGLFPTKTSSKKSTGVKNNICCLRSCKVCDQSTTSLKMLICDLCEESFHMSCCNPPIKKVPVGDWFCHSCLRKKLKKMKETNSSKSAKVYSGPIASMLRDADPYTSNVRIGKDFQADVPDWSGPFTDELNDYSEPMEMSPSGCASYQDWDSRKLSRLSSIGNWLQCREVVDGVDGTVCGKWRRAPLFEVQTDDWECFCSVLWDPTHADCAVPQEFDTDQVRKHLKYIEMLRPRLSVKRWKLGVNESVD